MWGEEWRDGEEEAANLALVSTAMSDGDGAESRGPGSRSVRHLSPSPQEQRWNSSRPWFPFRRCRVQTCPSRNTGLQIRVQK